MPSAFHTFKLVPTTMAQPNNRQPAPILPPSTPSNVRPSTTTTTAPTPTPAQQPISLQQQNTTPNSSTPSSDLRMNPPPLPRSLMTPAREMRESSVLSSAGSGTRKPRQNLDERDHILMVKHCYEQRGNYKEGTKAQFWTGVNTAFQRDTGKVLAQMSATVGRLVETRRRQIADWENGVIPQKPGGELNELLDKWMDFLKTEDGDAEAERMRQVDARRKVEEARKEARRQAIAAEALNPPPPQHSQVPRPYAGPYPPTPTDTSHPPSQSSGGEMVITNGNNEVQDVNGYRPHKRKRGNERALTRELQVQLEQQQQWHTQQQQATQQYIVDSPSEPPRRVVVEGQLTKEDWREIMGNDARLRALEVKVERIETLVTQNNKLLLQLVQNQTKERDRSTEEERVPVHLDAEFERDYLSGRYSKTPLPIP